MPTLKLSDYHVIVFIIAPVFRKCKGFPELFVLFFIKYGISLVFQIFLLNAVE